MAVPMNHRAAIVGLASLLPTLTGCGGRIFEDSDGGDDGGPAGETSTLADVIHDAAPDAPDVFSPPPGCPNAMALRAGLPCSVPGELCPGSPLLCQGQIDYDALRCQAGVWVTSAATICGDAGRD
jgi:hypothetical protein